MPRWFRFDEGIQTSITSSACLLRVKRLPAALLLTAACAALGCNSGSFMPPVNPELRGDGAATPVSVTDSTTVSNGSETSVTAARPIELVIGQHPPDESEYWKSSARTQAGLDKAKLHVSAPGPEDPPSRQAELVRMALTREPRVLIVEPSDPADSRLAEAVKSAQGKGIPVIVVSRPLAGEKAWFRGIGRENRVLRRTCGDIPFETAVRGFGQANGCRVYPGCPGR